MNFKRYKDSNYFISETSSVTVYVFRNYTGANFDFNQCFTAAFSQPFLVVFTYNSIDLDNPDIRNKFDAVLQGLGENSSQLIWIDDLQSTDYNTAPSIVVINHNEVQTFMLVKGSSDVVKLEKEFGTKLHISFEQANSQLIFKHLNNKQFKFFANRGTARYDQVTIKLKVDSKRREGAVVLNQGKFVATSVGVHAVSPYVNKSRVGSRFEPVSLVRYLSDTDLKSASVIEGVFYPYKVENAASKTQSFFSFKSISGNSLKIGANFVDSKGKRAVVNNLDALTLIPAKIALQGHSSKYFLIPDEKSSIEFECAANTDVILLGYSGTAAFENSNDSFKLEFKPTDKILVDTEKDVLESLTGGSQFTLPSFQSSHRFFLDSEKSPLFNNQRSEAAYDPIHVASLASNELLPIIPTLNFNKNTDDLIEIEKTFSRLRLPKKSDASAATTGTYITPQGFLKEGDVVNFIQNKHEKVLLAGLAQGDEPRFKVNLKKSSGAEIDLDFQLSLSKEDVFFVINPFILKAAVNSNVELDILFELNKFSVNLKSLLEPQFLADPTHGEQIIIFKFSKKSFKELIERPAQWSNNGIYANRRTLDAASAAILRYLGELPNTPDYEYLNKIKNDENWNGVVILNVPIAEPESLPGIFQGLAGSQTLQPDEETSPDESKLKLETGLNFQFVAFPVNKTFFNGRTVEIESTSFYGLIDYDILLARNEPNDLEPPTVKSDYKTVYHHFKPGEEPQDFKFILSKLLVRFENSEIRNFKSYAFAQIPNLFEDTIKIKSIKLSNKVSPPQLNNYPIKNLVRLEGNYQKNRAGNDEFNFAFIANITAEFGGAIIKSINLTKAAFNYVAENSGMYRFDFDGEVVFNPSALGETLRDFLKFEKLEFLNIGFSFPLEKGKLPKLDFDLSKLIVLPTIKFGDKGFLSSFPVKFNRFQAFDLTRPRFDFKEIPFLSNPLPNDGSLFGLIFDFDLGTLGNLSALKDLKGELLFGWSRRVGNTGGFILGLKLNKPSSDGVHIDLFGGLKLDIEKLDFCKFKDQDLYLLRLDDIRLTIFGTPLPPEKGKFSGLIFANPFAADDELKKIAWFISYQDNTKDKLTLGIGQRVGPDAVEVESVKRGVEILRKDIFDKSIDPCGDDNNRVKTFRKKDRNWLIASENFLPAAWSSKLDIKFIFNDPVLYGVYIELVQLGLSIDILYKNISENLGVWSIEISLPNTLRNIDMGGAAITLPNIGIEIYTNGDWKLDIGFPRGTDWSRSGFMQIRTTIPLVGWAGFYLMKATVANGTLFFVNGRSVLPPLEEGQKYLILQAGLALRVGVGVYINKGIFFAGASLSVYGILEGAFAFNPEGGVGKFFPDHFALLGRVGAIAEIVGYIDFKIVKAALYIRLSVEVGLLLIMIKGKGLLPAPLYIEGKVQVSVVVTICCFKIFGKKICIRVRFSFEAKVRFEFTIGGNSSNTFLLARRAAGLLSSREAVNAVSPIAIKEITRIPLSYIPGVTKAPEDGENLLLVHNFAIPFFGQATERNGSEYKVKFTEENLFKKIIRSLFSELIRELAKLPNPVEPTYKNLRSIFLEGKIQSATGEVIEIPLTFPEFRPWFITELDINNAGSDVVLHEIFGFEPPEITILRSNPNPCPEGTAAGDNGSNCIFRMIPIPISSKIVVGNGNTVTLFNNGFEIVVENIAVDEANQPSVKRPIGKIGRYTNDEIDEVNKWFDDYKTQYLERRNDPQSFSAEQTPPDLREELIIPEYFKLIGLITLEAYYERVVAYLKKIEETLKPEEREQYLNPIIEPGKISGEESKYEWKLNENIEDLIGQISYFYNNGLRLPIQPKISSSLTLGYFDVLQQKSSIKGKSNNPWNQAKVSISDTNNSVDITKEVFGTEADVTDFKNRIEKQAAVDFDKIRSAFTGEITKSYELHPVSLAVQNNQGPLEGSRFFEMPKKIFVQQPDAKFRLRLNAVERTSKDVIVENITVKASICANVGAKVRAHSVGNDQKTRILEISNVLIDDLSLMRRIWLEKDPDFLPKITIKLYRIVNDSLLQINSGKTLIVKTNLSTKTHPPIIGGAEEILRLAPDEIYIAETTDKTNFSRLLWEGLTTNNGGYFIQFENAVEGFYDANEKNKNYDLVFSFELPAKNQISEKFPAFCNYLRIADAELFVKLDKNSHYLFADLLSLSDDEHGNPIPVTEYHQKIPSHCLGFELMRDKQILINGNPAGDEYSQFLPLEFDLLRDGQTLISKEKTLPIMPTEIEEKPSKIFYKHITPAINYNDKDVDELGVHRNLNRYDAVGKDFTFNLGVRDFYGFRAIADLGILKEAHKQLYFDKLVPVESWSLIKFSYWLKNYSEANGMEWELTATINLEEIENLVGLSKENGGLNSTGLINDGILDVREVSENIVSILRNLYTIKAQLLGRGVAADIAGDSVQAKEFLLEVVNKTIEKVIEFRRTGVIAQESFYRTIIKKPAGKLREELKIAITIERLETLCVKPAEAWEAATVQKTIYDVKPSPARQLLVKGSNVTAGQNVDVLIDTNLRGNEKTIEFSLNYDSSILSRPAVVLHPDAGAATIRADSSVAGKIGISVISNRTFAAGNKPLVKITFRTTATAAGSTPLNFGDAPKVRRILDANGNVLSISFVNGQVTFGSQDGTAATNNPIERLHFEIAQKTGDNFGLGISCDAKREKLIYLISQKIIKDIQIRETPPLKRTNYFGIRPISNALWSGIYKDHANNEVLFSNIDLDASLQVVLAKIDEFLSPQFVEKNISQNQSSFDDLIKGKKKLVENRLRNRPANVDDAGLPNPILLEQEFKNLILERLNNFYNYDGIISLKLTDKSKKDINPDPPLGERPKPEEFNRLTVSLDNQSNYNLVSSKIGYFRADSDMTGMINEEWIILFDQNASEAQIKLKDVQPQITHIEFDIKKVDASSNVEASRWIQLIKPVGLRQKITVGVDWKRIERRFPAKPVIIEHSAQQPAENARLNEWSNRVGEWEYLLKLDNKENKYSQADKIYVKLNYKTNKNLLGFASGNSFEGFVAYWSQKFSDKIASYYWTKFADELNESALLNFAESDENQFVSNSYDFVIKKETETAPWSAIFPAPYTGEIMDENGAITVKIKGFNILKSGAITAIEAEIYVVRNSDAANNSAFIYKTEIVKSATWATPHIRYSNVLKLTSSSSFNQLVSIDIPAQSKFKSTAKWILNVGDFTDASLPMIPVKQMEFENKPAAPEFDSIFTGYENGHQAISLTIYSRDAEENLPIFHADTVKKT